MSILVTGGAGYIGSHMVQYLLSRRAEVVVIDNLRTGHRDAVPSGIPFLEADVGDTASVRSFLQEHRVRAVLHFAALSQVGESVRDPRAYFMGNVRCSLALLETVLDLGISTFVLSSTAAVYGNPVEVPIPETHPHEPINPYGYSKLVIEKALSEYARAYGLRTCALRYFNAAGAAFDGSLGERHEPESHLIPLVLDAASGSRESITIHGNDYDTPDGTCIRDYIHVDDLAEAHYAALRYLDHGGESGAFNLGTGRGHSVREVIDEVERVTKRTIRVEVGPRRQGDPARLVASPLKAKRAFDFIASRSTLTRIVTDAWNFHQKHQQPPKRGNP